MSLSSIAVLDRIKDNLDRYLSNLQGPADPPPQSGLLYSPDLANLRLNLARLQDTLDHATRKADDANAMLDAEVKALEEWLQKVR